MPSYSLSESDDDRSTPIGKPFGRQRPIYDILGRGKVADVLLWRDKRVSAGILVAVSIIWLLFKGVEYNFVTLLCHIIITTILVIFIWCMTADIFKWPPPTIPKAILHDTSSREIAAILHEKFDKFMSKFFKVACGDDFKKFILAIASLWILSVIGNYISTLNLLFLGCLCMEMLPYLYERYEEEVDDLVEQVNHRMRKSYKKFDSEFLRKIPRGLVKDKKSK
ncbi:Reticulon-like protein [Actinidia chinensis var. chinensis]|uniref:Reticulon-like protein n=1 Tax=Actinidia chinensis var. chinensis TaxID=1590841 RepID=A0A2R6QIF9_ACTCC|nr:Reticulon-like protein [Actinidia chinensis var. chinensis]